MVMAEWAEAPRKDMTCPGNGSAGMGARASVTPWPVPLKAATVLVSQVLVKIHRTQCLCGAA